MKINKKIKKGFSIGEVILSVFVLSVGIVGTFKLYADSIRSFITERESVVASMLAQEGVELIRNVRDNNWAFRDRPLVTGSGSHWASTFEDFQEANNCRRDYSDTGSIQCDGSYTLYTDNTNGFYKHSSGGATVSKFKRRIVIVYDDPVTPKEVIVTSLVSWGSSNPPADKSSCSLATKCVFSESILRDWGTGS